MIPILDLELQIFVNFLNWELTWHYLIIATCYVELYNPAVHMYDDNSSVSIVKWKMRFL